MIFDFQWDPEKALLNNKKHGVSFAEAQTVFYDALALTIEDELHSIQEERFIMIGYSDQGRLLIVVYTYRGEAIRIISARMSTKSERRIYEQGD